MLRINISKQAEKLLLKLPANHARQVATKITELLTAILLEALSTQLTVAVRCINLC